MYEILVTEPLRTSECAGECRFSVKLCKRALDVTGDIIVRVNKYYWKPLEEKMSILKSFHQKLQNMYNL